MSADPLAWLIPYRRVTDHIEVHLRPGADHPDDRLRLMTGGYEALSVGD